MCAALTFTDDLSVGCPHPEVAVDVAADDGMHSLATRAAERAAQLGGGGERCLSIREPGLLGAHRENPSVAQQH
jgi:hypothetical protein